MGSSGSMRAHIGTLIIATSGVQLANGFFNTLISLRVAIESFEATMAGLVLGSYFAGVTLAALRCGPIIERVGHIRAYAAFAGMVACRSSGISRSLSPFFWSVCSHGTPRRKDHCPEGEHNWKKGCWSSHAVLPWS
jgi:MFS family permease